MEVFYKTFAKTMPGKAEKMYINYAVSMIGCCQHCIAFIMMNKVDFVTGENFLLVKQQEGEPALKMLYCQFCGQRHTSVEIKDEDKTKNKTKTKTKVI